MRHETEGRSVDYVQPGMSSVQTAHLATAGESESARDGTRCGCRGWIRRATSGGEVELRVTLNVVP